MCNKPLGLQSAEFPPSVCRIFRIIFRRNVRRISAECPPIFAPNLAPKFPPTRQRPPTRPNLFVAHFRPLQVRIACVLSVKKSAPEIRWKPRKNRLTNSGPQSDRRRGELVGGSVRWSGRLSGRGWGAPPPGGGPGGSSAPPTPPSPGEPCPRPPRPLGVLARRAPGRESHADISRLLNCTKASLATIGAYPKENPKSQK